MKPTPAKIIQHSQGLGVPSTEMVRQRALELARIDGRSEYHERDWHEAKRELHGGHETLANDGADEMTTMVSGHDMVSSDVGHRVETFGPDGADSMGEELIAEGMEEAVHDQMLAAARDEETEEEN
jgi:Protein of unknown function (DUF2934)